MALSNTMVRAFLFVWIHRQTAQNSFSRLPMDPEKHFSGPRPFDESGCCCPVSRCPPSQLASRRVLTTQTRGQPPCGKQQLRKDGDLRAREGACRRACSGCEVSGALNTSRSEPVASSYTAASTTRTDGARRPIKPVRHGVPIVTQASAPAAASWSDVHAQLAPTPACPSASQPQLSTSPSASSATPCRVPSATCVTAACARKASSKC